MEQVPGTEKKKGFGERVVHDMEERPVDPEHAAEPKPRGGKPHGLDAGIG